MQRDYLGNPVTGGNAATLHAIDEFIEGYLAYETRAEQILAAADADPQSSLANTYAGILWMLLEAPEAAQRAAPYVQAALRAAPGATRRENLNAQMLDAWSADKMQLTEGLCEQIIDEFPRDLAIVKLRQYFAFNRGDSPAMLRAACKALHAAPEVPFVHGMLAFAYEQCHLLVEAEAAARHALAMRRKEPWAQHALAHVLLTRGRIDEGVAFLEEAAEGWQDLNSFMVTHIWWHLALFYLSQGRFEAALEVYDRHCWGVANTYSQDQIGAISLLARFEIAGIEVGTRWQDVAGYLAARAHDTVQPFLTLQYLYGLARAGREEAVVLLDAMRAAAAAASGTHRNVWQEVALPAGIGLCAYAKGDFEAAWRQLQPALPRMLEIGGSHAQRDLFEQILVDAAHKSGRLIAAQQLLELRRLSDPDGVPVNMALARVYQELDLEPLAANARARASQTRSRHGR